MSKQPDLFGRAPVPYVPFVAPSLTSSAAAKSLTPEIVTGLELLVFNALRLRAKTCDEVEVQLMLPHQTVSARIRGLVLAGRVVDSGERRPTRSGRQATVWKVT